MALFKLEMIQTDDAGSVVRLSLVRIKAVRKSAKFSCCSNTVMWGLININILIYITKLT